MKITVFQVEGTTTRRGAKQNKTYTITTQHPYNNARFYDATDGKNGFTIWNVKGDWSQVGIKRDGQMRTTYTNNFKID